MRNLFVYVGEVGVVFDIFVTDAQGAALSLAGADAVYMDIEGVGSFSCALTDLPSGNVRYTVLGTEFTLPSVRVGQMRAVWTDPSAATIKTQDFEFEIRRSVLLP